MMEEHIAGLGLDMGKEEDIKTLCNIIGKPRGKGAREFREPMKDQEYSGSDRKEN